MSGGDEVHNEISGVVGDGSVVQAHSIGSVNFFRSPPVPVEPTDPWMLAVARSAAWDHVRVPGDLRDRAVEVAGRLAALRPGTTSDPWHDAGLAERFAKRVGWLLRHRLRDALVLDPAEAALLALVPLLHQVLWDGAAAELGVVGPADLEQTGTQDDHRASYEKHLRDHSRLVERALLPDLPDRSDAHADIGWWLFHRWVGQRAEVVKRKSVGRLLAQVDSGPLREVLDVDRVRELLYGLRLEPQELCGPERLGKFAPHDTLHGGEPDEQRIRIPLLGLLLGVAHTATTPITDLSDTIVWHLGIPAPVDLARLHETLATATWETQADGMVLKAACQHGAVIEALREQAARMDSLLHAVRRAAEKHGGLEVLGRLPVRASADQVDAACDPDGAPEFSGWSRFTLDEQRVRELLMGEQLYRDRDLAIRELYQNALDACRYQRAREQYVERTTDRRSSWEGRITFTQGIDEHGRAYLDCTDNGVGMGEEELKGVFSRAGVRFADLAGFRDEQADWNALDPPVELYPNSRFGIGVLSYFMLADEITVTTCRTARDGSRREPTLRATISGPGHVFQIHPVEDRGSPGTTVRLYLGGGRGTSCVQVLRQVLGIAEFRTTAQHGPEHEEWSPGVFHPRKRSALKSSGLNAYGTLIPTAGGRVVWCEHGGAVLVDGLLVWPAKRHGVLSDPAHVGPITGVVVNLTGKRVPRLSVDRTEIVDDVYADVEELIREGVTELDLDALPAFEWIGRVGRASPRLADLVAKRTSSTQPVRFPQDAHLPHKPFRGVAGDRAQLTGMSRNTRPTTLPDHIYLWRLLANGPGPVLTAFVDLVPELARVGLPLPALPSDVALLADVWPVLQWRGFDVPLSPHDIIYVAQRTGGTPREVALRAAALNLGCPEADRFSDDRVPDRGDLLLVRNDVGTLHDEATHSCTASPGQVLYGCAELGLSVAEVTGRLSRYGFDVEAVTDLPERLDDVDVLLLSRNPDRTGSDWLAREFPVPAVHVAWISSVLDSTTRWVRERLRGYGFEVEERDVQVLSRDDFAVMSHSRDGDPPWLDHAIPVPPGHVVAVAEDRGISTSDVVELLTAYGFRCRPLPGEHPAPGDRELLSRDLSWNGPWLQVGQPLPPRHIPMFRRMYGFSAAEVVTRLTAYGFDVREEGQPDVMEADDLVLLSVDFDGAHPWLNRGKPVRLVHLVEASARFSMTIPEVVGRLRRLGVDVPDPAAVIRAVIPKIPLAE